MTTRGVRRCHAILADLQAAVYAFPEIFPYPGGVIQQAFRGQQPHVRLPRSIRCRLVRLQNGSGKWDPAGTETRAGKGRWPSART
jgi:hypothetical protein